MSVFSCSPSQNKGILDALQKEHIEIFLEAAGLRLSFYLRSVPMREKRRQEVILAVLTNLETDLKGGKCLDMGDVMDALQTLLAGEVFQVRALAAPPLKRLSMCPEELDRRPWVRVFLRFWRPFWVFTAHVNNTSLLGIVCYALLLGGLFYGLPRG